MISFRLPFTTFIRQLQADICAELEAVDGAARFVEDEWHREGGGGGRTRIIAGGRVFEKGGVNISEVHGLLPESMQLYLKAPEAQFFACGISIVLHPVNPYVPTVHANYRYFELYNAEGAIADQWFAGGSDLTPYYLFEEDAVHFHRVQKETCDAFNEAYYPAFKKACDAYFFNQHRGEARGIGGIFFDHRRGSAEASADYWFDFTTSLASAFTKSYLPIAERRVNTPYDEPQRHWQEIRRGRYVEFNLIHDKGTLFGLRTNGRIESILMSLPPVVRWEYNAQPAPGSEEEKLTDVLIHPRDWL